MVVRFLLAVALLFPALAPAQPSQEASHHAVLLAQVRGELGFLASEALRGRGSGSHDELVAATYIASQFQGFGLDEAHVQRVTLASGGETYNAVAVLRGSDLASEAILLSAHLDHLGVQDGRFYPGADDDASGTVAVMELARTLAARKHRRRTVIFVSFGSEETGGQGNEYFMAHPPVPLSSIVANLEFEMIGRRDPAVADNALWLTGWERSDLGPMLAKHGAKLVADPHPEQKFFARSDNIALARRGIVAQTVSSFGLGAHYHQPSDDAAHIDYEHLATAIDVMTAPIEWLAETDWKPSWNPGGKP
jgi:Zn-dependent M28 family amino/carboxypeptidase